MSVRQFSFHLGGLAVNVQEWASELEEETPDISHGQGESADGREVQVDDLRR